MLTIQQQMIKSLRQLQNYTNAGGDLFKTFRHVSVVSDSTKQQIPSTTYLFPAIILADSNNALNEQQFNNNEEEKYQKHQQQLSTESQTIIKDSSQQTDMPSIATTTTSEKFAIKNFISQLNSHACENENFSLISCTNVNGLVSVNLLTILLNVNANTQDSNNRRIITKKTLLPTSLLKSFVFEASTVFTRQQHNHHQRIHNFSLKQNQKSFIHTQSNNNQTNLYAEQQQKQQKQKEKHKILNQQQQQQQQIHQQHQQQTQFAMSSLAAAVAAAPATTPVAAEPLSLKKDEIVATNGRNGSDCLESNNNADLKKNSKPCFNRGLSEILQFMELIGNLKHTKRTGWVLRDVNDCESISGHMYRMSMMTFLLDGSEGLNQIRCMELALVHDLAESLVGDITPFCGVSKTEKRAMEFKAMEDICKLIEPRGKRIMELFEEYEQGESDESKFVKDLDRLDMVMQAFEYEKRDDCLLKHQEFFDSTEGKFKHPFVKKLVNEIYEQRRDLAKAKGASPPPTIIVPNMDDETIKSSNLNTNGHAIEENDGTKSRLDINTKSNSS